MRVMLISYVFPPFGGAGVQRISKLAEFLVKGGHTVSVVTHEAGLVKDTDLNSDELKHVDVLRVSFFDHSNSLDHKISSELASFLALQNPEVILSSSPTIEAHFLAMKLKCICSASWIADFRDIQSEYVSRINYLAWRAIAKIEREIVNSCDAVVVISDYHKTYLLQHYAIPEHKVTVVMNGYDAGDFSEVSETARNELRSAASSLTLVHVGTFYGKRSPLFLIINCILARNKVGVELKIQLVGKMGRSAELITKLFSKIIPIEIVATVSHRRAIQLMCHADVLVLVPGWFGVGVITGKVFEYVASGRPVINLYSYKGPLTDILAGVTGVFNVHELDFRNFSKVIEKLKCAERSHCYVRSEFQRYERFNQYKKLEAMMQAIN